MGEEREVWMMEVRVYSILDPACVADCFGRVVFDLLWRILQYTPHSAFIL